MENPGSYKPCKRQISVRCGFDSHLLDQLENKLWSNFTVINKCIVWTGPKDSSAGYGGFYLNGIKYRVSRVSALLYLGADIDDTKQFICHTCDNPPCFNPEHLYLGNAQTNRSDQSDRQLDTCNQGHKLTEDNSYYQGIWRSCLTCRRERARASYNKKRLAL